jgi:hypothetical protein
MGIVDVPLLALLRATGQQDYERLAILSEIDPVSGTEIHPVLEHAAADTFYIREIALPDPNQGGGHPSCRLGVEPLEPFAEWATATTVNVLPDCKHLSMVSPMLPSGKNAGS